MVQQSVCHAHSAGVRIAIGHLKTARARCPRCTPAPKYFPRTPISSLHALDRATPDVGSE